MRMKKLYTYILIFIILSIIISLIDYFIGNILIAAIIIGILSGIFISPALYSILISSSSIIVTYLIILFKNISVPGAYKIIAIASDIIGMNQFILIVIPLILSITVSGLLAASVRSIIDNILRRK